MRGRAVDSRRSRNSHMRSPRRVTCAPIGWPSRSLNCAIDLRARVTCGFWPVMRDRSRIAPSMSLESRAASPTPMLTTILVKVATWLMFGCANSSRSPATISSRYFFFSRGSSATVAVFSLISDVLTGTLGDADALGALHPVALDLLGADPHPGALLGLRVHDHDRSEEHTSELQS